MDALRKVRSYVSWKLFFIIVTIMLLIAAIIFVYKNYLVPMMNPPYAPNKEFVDTDEEDKECELMIFTVDWCPYCKKAMPIWNNFKKEYEGKKINGYTLYFTTINCTDENDSNIKDMLNKYNVEGYPTIKMVKDGEVISYDAKPDNETLQQFVRAVLV